MMSKLRQYTKTILWVVIVAFVGTIIFAWGKGGFRGDGRDRDLVGEVEGYQVRSRDFYMLYDQLYRQVLEEKGEVDEDTEGRLLESTWAQIRNEILVQSWIEDLGLVVTSQELVESIKAYPPQEWTENPPEWLATEGKFDYNKYLQLLASDDPAVVQQLFVPLEQQYRHRMIVDKVQRLIASTSRVTSPEVERDYIDENENVKVRYLFIDAAQYEGKEGEISEEEIRNYYITNKDKEFTHGEAANLKYARFKIEPAQEEVDSVKAEIEEIREMARKGGDFAELASAYSDHASASRGGDLGWLRKGPQSGELEEVAFSLKVGEVSEPLKSPEGWQILKVTDQKQEKDKEGEWETQVRTSTILLKVVASDATEETIYSRAQDFLGRADKKNFDQLAGEFGLEVKETGIFTPGKSVPSIQENREAINHFAFASKVGTVSPIYRSKSGFHICIVFERIRPGYIPFDEIKDKIREELTYRRRAKLAEEKAKEICAEMSAGATLQGAAQRHGYEIRETPYFARSGRVPGVGRLAEFIVAAFSLNEKKPFRVASTEGGSYLIELVDRTPADMEKFVGEEEALRSEATAKAQKMTMDLWYTYIVNHGEIKDYRDRFFGR
jgi:peptidyl-prolyl cis-trans isomerase D